MYIRRLIYSSVGKYIISIILGLGIATLFRRVCKDRSCLVFKAPSMNKVRNQVFKFDDKCYIFKEHGQKCDPNKKTMQFA